MNFNGLNIKVIAITLVTVLALLLTGNMLYRQLNIVKPLDEFYSKTTQIQDYKIVNDSNGYTITVNLKGVDNLKDFYAYLEDNTRVLLKNNKFKIEIVNDVIDGKLNDVYNKLQFSVYEGIQTGGYITMNKEIETISETAGVFAKVYIDDENIYLKLKNNDEELYYVFLRETKSTHDLL